MDLFFAVIQLISFLKDMKEISQDEQIRKFWEQMQRSGSPLIELIKDTKTSSLNNPVEVTPTSYRQVEDTQIFEFEYVVKRLNKNGNLRIEHNLITSKTDIIGQLHYITVHIIPNEYLAHITCPLGEILIPSERHPGKTQVLLPNILLTDGNGRTIAEADVIDIRLIERLILTLRDSGRNLRS